MENEDSFKLIVAKYEKLIYFILNNYKKRYYINKYDIDELYNESLILLYKCIFSFRDDLGFFFKSYYMTSLNNYLYNLLRSENSLKRANEFSDYSLDYIYDDNMIFSQVIADNKSSYHFNNLNYCFLKDSIYKINGSLKSEEKLIFTYFIEGYQYKEIADMLKIKIKKVDNTIQKCRKLINNIYNQ
jgi:RNA polymerase sigma factor (sigma-70 family)